MDTKKRLTVSRAEAAEMLGVSMTLFDEQIAPQLRLVRMGPASRGRRVLVPVAELERWIDRSAAKLAA